MNFQHLRFAISVAETGSFTRAADICCVTQPALSNAIGQLEEELGSRLFERTTRSVTTTEFGAVMIEKMRDVVAARQNLLSSASDFLTRDDKVVRIGQSPLISADFSKAMLSRAKQNDLELVLTEMNKADIGPALQSGTIDFGLSPSPQDNTNMQSAQIYSEPLFVVSDQPNTGAACSSSIADIAERKILLVPDDCGLSDTVRFLFQDQNLELDVYEGRALAYHVLENWAHLGIGVTLLPASQVTKPEFASPLKSITDTIVSIQFEAHWTANQEKRKSFGAIISCLGIAAN